MTSSAQNGSLSMCAISLEHKDDFCASPPFGFHVVENTGRMVCEDSSVIILVRDTKFEGRDVVIEVFTSTILCMTESSFLLVLQNLTTARKAATLFWHTVSFFCPTQSPEKFTAPRL